jgi:hypothetical protein
VAYQDMRAELRGSVAKLPFAFTGTLINRAWRVVRESTLWSFNCFGSSWITPPPLIGIGGATTVQGSPAIQFDATATAAINANTLANMYAPPTVYQFRVGVGGIYSIIQYNNLTGAALLDRIFADPSITDQAFQMYQLYYPAPYQDFLTWFSVRNPQMFINFNLQTTRSMLDAMDPQRTWYQFPTRAVPFGYDNRGAGTPNASSTLGYPLFELWGQPVTPYTYQCYGCRRGVALVNPTDTLPAAIGEDLVLAKAREYAYEWAEANKDMAPRASGPDYRFLMTKTQDEYTKLLTHYRKDDREFISNYFSMVGMGTGTGVGIYNTIAGVAAPYGPA